MAKKQKITVNLPGGIAGLVHTVQRGESAPAREESRVEEQPVAPENEQTPSLLPKKPLKNRLKPLHHLLERKKNRKKRLLLRKKRQ